MTMDGMDDRLKDDDAGDQAHDLPENCKFGLKFEARVAHIGKEFGFLV